VTGAGCALDAASRGLSVGLVEASDWASGTSSRSSKLVHGGLRYLEMLKFGFVREGLRERALMLSHLAPHLVRPVPILCPLRGRSERAYAGAGVALYDLLAALSGQRAGLPLHRHLSKRQALEVAPGLRDHVVAGAILYWDAQVDDARYVVELVRTAAAYGAIPVSRARVSGFNLSGGRLRGATVRDEETGDELDVRARVTISATGVWSEETEALAGRDRPVLVRPSKGAHLVVGRGTIASSTGLIFRTEASVLFVLPWGEHWLIGTTDTDWPYDKASPLATAGDVDYLLAELNRVLTRPLSRSDVLAAYAGLRPLIAGGGVVGRGPGDVSALTPTTRLSREHAVGRPLPGFVVVSGGKYTTYRLMAKDAVDTAVAEGALHALPCRTESIALLGARGFQEAPQRTAPKAAAAGLTEAQLAGLVRQYGSLASEVVALAASAPELRQEVPGQGGYLAAQLAHAVTHEGALHVEDVLCRRLRALSESPGWGRAAVPSAVKVMAPLLGWDGARVAAEQTSYERLASLWERAASEAPDDAAAVAMAKELG
jgi:glycerol-3-phosphate dehydrogenase